MAKKSFSRYVLGGKTDAGDKMKPAPSKVHVGEKYNRWTVISHIEKRGPHHYWLCRCECGHESVIQQGSIVRGASRSCGCLRVDVNSVLHRTHGACDHPAYQSWSAMRRRCQDPKFEGFALYGDRGITVCERWQSFEGFWEDMGPTWAAGLTIDRKNVNGNYEPSNCRWATGTEQANNKRNSAIIDTPWGPLTKTMAARAAGISRSTLKHRIERGWPVGRWFDPQKAA